MRAVVQRSYGSPDLLQIEQVEDPTPEDHEVLIRVHAAAVTLSDSMVRRGRPLAVRLFSGLLRPKKPIQGAEFAGEVAGVGRDVQRFEVGDRVFGSTGDEGGCYAELVSVPEDGFVATMPSNMTYEEAASVCGGLAAWNFLRHKVSLERGQKVLISGATGPIGTTAVQLARQVGAEVTAVCSTANIDLVRSLGATKVIDYTEDDFTEGTERYDVVFDAENKSSFLRCRRVLSRDGVYLRTYPGPAILLQMLWTSRIGRKKAVISATGLLPVTKRLALLEELKRRIEANEVESVVDRSYPLEQIADAHRWAERGHKRGTVVVTVVPAESGTQ